MVCVKGGVLKLHHPIGPPGDLGAGKDLRGGARFYRPGRHRPRRDLLQDGQGHRVLRGRPLGVLPPQGEAVIGGAVKQGHILPGRQVLGQDPPPAQGEGDGLSPHRPDALQQQLPGPLK